VLLFYTRCQKGVLIGAIRVIGAKVAGELGKLSKIKKSQEQKEPGKPRDLEEPGR
jgi:hypothetical protein